MNTQSARPEPVEGHPFFLGAREKGAAFDKLRPNGFFVEVLS
jgi:hypothetical protein